MWKQHQTSSKMSNQYSTSEGIKDGNRKQNPYRKVWLEERKRPEEVSPSLKECSHSQPLVQQEKGQRNKLHWAHSTPIFKCSSLVKPPATQNSSNLFDAVSNYLQLENWLSGRSHALHVWEPRFDLRAPPLELNFEQEFQFILPCFFLVDLSSNIVINESATGYKIVNFLGQRARWRIMNPNGTSLVAQR